LHPTRSARSCARICAVWWLESSRAAQNERLISDPERRRLHRSTATGNIHTGDGIDLASVVAIAQPSSSWRFRGGVAVGADGVLVDVGGTVEVEISVGVGVNVGVATVRVGVTVGVGSELVAVGVTVDVGVGVGVGIP
jgi:hypothetical protein